MYCPSCFNNSLSISNSGSVSIFINEKKRDTGTFLYNQSNEPADKILKKLDQKIKEFFDWYAKLGNKEVITKVLICSTSFDCTNGCAPPRGLQQSVVGPLFSKSEVIQILEKYGKEFGLMIDIDQSTL